MNWNETWNMVLAIIASIGGAGFIIVAIVKYSSGIIAERLSAKYNLELNKKMEEYKSLVDKQNYVSKARFDTEYNICKEIMVASKNMLDYVYCLFPDKTLESIYGQSVDQNGIKENASLKVAEKIKAFEDLLEGNSPFIPQEVYEEFNELKGMCQANLFSYQCSDAENPFYNSVSDKDREQLISDAYDRTQEIVNRMNTIASMLRQHFQNMDIQN